MHCLNIDTLLSCEVERNAYINVHKKVKAKDKFTTTIRRLQRYKYIETKCITYSNYYPTEAGGNSTGIACSAKATTIVEFVRKPAVLPQSCNLAIAEHPPSCHPDLVPESNGRLQSYLHLAIGR